MRLQRAAWSAPTCFRAPRCQPAWPVLHRGMATCPWDNRAESYVDALREDSIWGAQRTSIWKNESRNLPDPGIPGEHQLESKERYNIALPPLAVFTSKRASFYVLCRINLEETGWSELQQLKYGLCRLRTSKRLASFQKDVIFQSAYWNCWVHSAIFGWPANSPLSDPEHFKMPADPSDCRLDLQTWALLHVTRQLDKAHARNATDYSWSMGALFKSRKNPPLPSKTRREIMSPAGARRGFKQQWTLTKHTVWFGSAREARDIVFSVAGPGKAAGSLHVPAARHPKPQEVRFPKAQAIPNNFWAKPSHVKCFILSVE